MEMIKATRTAVCCDRCGSIDIQLSAWVDALTDLDVGDDGPTDQGWCAQCETHDTDCRNITDAEAEAVDRVRRGAALGRLRALAPEAWVLLPENVRAGADHARPEFARPWLCVECDGTGTNADLHDCLECDGTGSAPDQADSTAPARGV